MPGLFERIEDEDKVAEIARIRAEGGAVEIYVNSELDEHQLTSHNLRDMVNSNAPAGTKSIIFHMGAPLLPAFSVALGVVKRGDDCKVLNDAALYVSTDARYSQRPRQSETLGDMVARWGSRGNGASHRS